MDDTQMLDCTQALPDDVWDDLDSTKPKLVAVLEVGETTYDVFEGESKIGRDPATCDIIINKPVLSKEHAVLEVEGDSHMIADLGSRNKTRIGKLVLKPHVRYALRGGEELRFGDVCSKYFIKSSDEEESDTCSESMLDATDQVSPRIGSLQVPETPETNKLKTSESVNAVGNHVIPESPSASQSTPLPSSGQLAIDKKKPPNVSAIKLPDLSAIEEDDDDSFFFVSTQPKENPNIKVINTNTNRSKDVQGDGDIDSDASTDVELESEKEQSIKSAKQTNLNVGNVAQDDKEKPDDKQMNYKVTVTSAKDKKGLSEEGYNSEASTDIEDDDDDVISESKNIKQLCNDEQENNNNTRKDINSDTKSKTVPEDIFNQPTKEFPLELEEGTQIAEAFGLLNKTPSNDNSYALGDNTQDILEAFSCSSSKASPKRKTKEVGKEIFDMPTQAFTDEEDADQPTQPYQNEEKTFLAAGQDAEEDDYVPTQLFLDDSDSKVFKMPYSVSPAMASSSKRNQEVKDDNRRSPYKQALSEFDEEIFDQPTQKYDDIRAIAEEATQLFQDPCLTEKTSCDGASAEKIQQDSVKPCHTEKVPFNQADDSGVSLDKPTAVNYHEDSDTDVEDDFAPTQKFSPRPKVKPLGIEAQPISGKDDLNKSASGDDDDDSDDLPPTQIFPTKPVFKQKGSPQSGPQVFTPPRKIPSTCAGRVAEEKLCEQNLDDCRPTQAYSGGCKTINDEEKSVKDDQDDFAPTQVFTAKGTTTVLEDKSVEDDQDDLPPTQAFPAKGTTSIFEDKASEHEEDLMPTQPFPLKPETRVIKEKLHEGDEDDMMPTQVFSSKPETKGIKEKLHENDQDDLMPTQVFSDKTQTNEKVNKTNEYNEDSDTDIDDDTIPLQGSPKSHTAKQNKEGSSKQEWQLVVTDEGESFCNPSEISDGELAPTQELNTNNGKKTKMADKPFKIQEKENGNDEEDLPPTQVFQEKVLKSTPKKSKYDYCKGNSSFTDIGFELLPTKICGNTSTSATPEKTTTFQVNISKENTNLLETSDLKGVVYKATVGGDDSDLASTQVFTVPGKQIVEEEQGDVDDCDATQELDIDAPISLHEELVRTSSPLKRGREEGADIIKDMQKEPVEDDNYSDTSETLLRDELDVDPGVPEVMSKNTGGEENLVQEPGMSQQDTMILNPSCDPCGASSTTNLPKTDFDTTSAGFIPGGAKVHEDVLEMHSKEDSANKKGNSASEIADQKNEELLGKSKNSKFIIVTKEPTFGYNRMRTSDKTPIQAKDPLPMEEEEEEVEDTHNFSHDLRQMWGIGMDSSDSENEEVEKSQILFEIPQEIPPVDKVHDSKRNGDTTPKTNWEIENKKSEKGKAADSKSKSVKHIQDSAEGHEHKKPDSENMSKNSEECDSKNESRKCLGSDSENKNKKSHESDSKRERRKSVESDSKKESRKSVESDSKKKSTKLPESDSEDKDGKLPEKSISHKKDEKSEEKSKSENKSRRSREESKSKNRKSHEESESKNKTRRSHRMSDVKNKSRELPEESDSSKNRKSPGESSSGKNRKSPEESDSENKDRSQKMSDSKNKSRKSCDKPDSKNISRKLPEKSDSKKRGRRSNRAEPSAKSENQSSDNEFEDKSSHKVHGKTQDKKSKKGTDRSPEREQKTGEEVEKAAGFSGFQRSPHMKRKQVLEKLKENLKVEEASSVAEEQPKSGKEIKSEDQVSSKTEVDIPSSSSSSRRSRKRTQPSHEMDSSEVVESSNELLVGQRTTRKSVTGGEDPGPRTKERKKEHENTQNTSHVRESKSRKKEDESTKEDVSERHSGTFSSPPPRQRRSRREKDSLNMVKCTSTDNEAEICTAKDGSQGSSSSNLETESMNNEQQSDMPRGQHKRNSRKSAPDESAKMKTSAVRTKDSGVHYEENTNTGKTSRSRRSRATANHESDANSGEIDQNEISGESKAEKRKKQGKSEKEKDAIKQEHTEEVQSTASQKSQKPSAAEVKRRRTTQVELHVIKEDSVFETSQIKSTEECSQPKQGGRRSGRSSTANSSQDEDEEEAKPPKGRASRVPRMSVVYEPPGTPRSSRKRSSSQSSTGSDMSTESKKKQRGEKESSVTRTSRSSRSSQKSGKESPGHHKDTVLWSPKQRQYQASTKPRVMFTGYTDQADENIVVDLGGTLVDTAQECTVLVTTNIRRTCKFLSIMGKGQPIVSPEWLAASKLANSFVDPWKYLVKDVESEKKFSFKLETSLKQAKIRKVFDDISIHATPKVKPPRDQLKEIVECAGGEYLDNQPKMPSEYLFVVSCADDKRVFTKLKREGFQVVGTEFILTGLLQQKLLTKIYDL